MTAARTVRVLTAREVGDRLRSKAYRYGTILSVLVVVGLIVIPGVLAGGGPKHYSLGLVGAVPAGFEPALRAASATLDVRIDPVEFTGDDTETTAAAITAGQVDAALIDGTVLMVAGTPDLELLAAVETALHQLDVTAAAQAAGLTPAEVSAILAAPEPLTVVDTTGQQNTGEAYLFAFAATVLLILTVMMNAGSVMTGVLEEKTSRVVEVLLGSVRPWQLLTAKIIALTFLALAQVGIIVAAALAANAVLGTVELPPATTSTIVVALVMLLIGFVFYAALYAVAGSLASTVEDAQASVLPLNLVVTAGYLGVIFAVLPNPHGTLAQLLTYLPPTAPFTVPARVALDAISPWEVAAACVVTLLGVMLTVWLSARLYSASLLSSGRLSWGQAWRSEAIR